MLIIFACLAGILLGLIFNVATLLSVILVGAAAYAASAGQNQGEIVLAIVVSSISVQAGYMIGLTSRDLFAQILERLNIVQSKQV
jgi:uncharacterized membrane protein (UPF0136 family)